MPVEDDDEQWASWDRFYDGVRNVLKEFGTENHFGHGDYLVLEDNYGPRYTHIEVHKLHMIDPQIVTRLQKLLEHDPRWHISIAVHVHGPNPKWPPMGLMIWQHEIIDGLLRHYLPEPYRSFCYEGSRPGTASDW
jgi:hypothetical protein